MGTVSSTRFVSYIPNTEYIDAAHNVYNKMVLWKGSYVMCEVKE